MRFSLQAQCNDARTGVIHTARGDIQTPAFMPIGTYGAIKGLSRKMPKNWGLMLFSAIPFIFGFVRALILFATTAGCTALAAGGDPS